VPEDVIGLKLQAMCNDSSRYTSDLADIEWLMRHYWAKMDMKLIKEYFDIFSLNEEFNKIIVQVNNA